MKNIIAIISIFSFLGLQSQDGVLVKNDGKTFVTVEEFKEKFDYTLDHDPIQSKEEILTYYITTKLKVEEAEKLGLQSSPEYIKEMSDFIKEKDSYYLKQDAVYANLRNQFEERSGVEFQLTQYFASDLTPSTAREYQKAFAKNTFFFNKKSKVKKVETKYIRVGELPYNFEEEIFKDVSKGRVLESHDLGNQQYVFTFIHDVRPYSGIYKFQLLLIKDTLDTGTNKINSLYQKIQQGESFEDIKRRFSEDENSKYRPSITLDGTTLDNTTLGILNQLEKGEVSSPFKTTFGWNLVKLIDHEAGQSKKALDEQFTYAVEYNMLLNEHKVKEIDSRLKPVQNEVNLINDIENEKLVALFKKDSISKETYDKELTNLIKTEIKEKKIVVFNNGMSYTNWNFISDNALLLRNIYRNNEEKKQAIIEQQLPVSIIKAKVLLFDNMQKEFNPQYKAEIELLKTTLLTKLYDDYQFKTALNNKEALEQKYEEIKGDYTWGKRVEVWIAYCGKNREIAEEIKKKFKKKVVIEKLQQQYAENDVYFRKIKREFSSSDLPEGYSEKDKLKIYQEKGDYFVVKTLQVLPSQDPTYEELKPIVENQYKEEYLNQEIEKLKRNIDINQSTLKSL